MLCQQGDVFAAFAQRRNGDGKDIEPVEQIIPERSVEHHFLQVAVGGGHEAHIHGNDLVPAQAFNLARLQHTQKFRLQFQRDVANFVQHQRTALSQFKAPLALRASPGKGPFFVPEKFAFHKARWHCGAVHLDHALGFARAAIVDGLGKKLLAGAGFAQQQHGAVAGCHHVHLLQNAHDGVALPNDDAHVRLALYLFRKIEVFLRKVILLHRDSGVVQGIAHGNGHARGDLGQQADGFIGKDIGVAVGKQHGPEAVLAEMQRKQPRSLIAVAKNKFRGRVFARKPGQIALPRQQWGVDVVTALEQGVGQRKSTRWQHGIFSRLRRAGAVEGKRVVRFVQQQGKIAYAEESPYLARNHGHHGLHFKSTDGRVGHVHKDAEVVAFAAQVFGFLPHIVHAEDGCDRSRNHPGQHTKKNKRIVAEHAAVCFDKVHGAVAAALRGNGNKKAAAGIAVLVKISNVGKFPPQVFAFKAGHLGLAPELAQALLGRQVLF